MSIERTIKVHSVAEDGLPNMDDMDMVGRVAYLWGGAIVSGWPINPDFVNGETGWWEPSENRFGGKVRGVTHWVEFPLPVWNLEGRD